MSTDHHLDDNADDQVRDSRRDVHELEQIQEQLRGAPFPQTPAMIRGRHPGTSAIAGSIAGRDLPAGAALRDLVGPYPADPADSPGIPVDDRIPVIRIVGADIREGQEMEVREDGKVYPVDEDAADLADQLVDVAETAAAADDVDQAIDAAATATPDYDFAEAIAGMANRHLQEAGLALEVVEACSGCGCTNNRACVLENPRSIGGGMHVTTCHWIQTPPGQPARCSKCGPTAEAYAANPATIMGIRVHLDPDLPEGQMQLRDPVTGETLMTIHNIGAPSAEEATRAQVLLSAGQDEHPLPYAAPATITVHRYADQLRGPFEERARRR